nr:MAG TPA: hypothetical protein [Caudoviricetes sp.]
MVNTVITFAPVVWFCALTFFYYIGRFAILPYLPSDISKIRLYSIGCIFY